MSPSLLQLERWIVDHVATRLGVPPASIDTAKRFRQLGVDSVAATSMLVSIGEKLGRPLPPTLAWQFPTVATLAHHLAGGQDSPLLDDGLRKRGALDEEPVAIVGVACRFPMASSPEAFWGLLSGGIDAIRELPRGRWSPDLYDPDPAAPGKTSTRWGGFLDDVAGFDAAFFGISPREAALMDPQQRLMLELCWEALEDVGIAPTTLRDTRTGVFIGAMWMDYAQLPGFSREAIGPHSATGHDLSIVPARVSYTLGLRGPSIAVNTACSSSLVAVHLACHSLLRGESSLALAGGVNLLLAPESTIAMSKFGAMAPDGRSKAFDARANGYVRGEGGGVVALKRLSEAIRDGDRIYCVIRGSAVNNDGFSNGLTAPSLRAQEAVLRDACANAGISPGDVQYVEAHGTGTLLGDPIEAGALGLALGSGRPSARPLRIGSVKTNIGHLEPAAGIAGLLKVALAMRHRALPASLHFERPNPHIAFDALRLRVQTALEPWEGDGGRLVAGVSSFGFGGTNSHVVLESAPSRPKVAFLFGGQGSQWHGMGRALLRDDSAARSALERCDRAMRAYTKWSLVERLVAGDADLLDQSDFVLPAVFAVQVALAAAWAARGVVPDVVVGQSMGEISAAFVAGALTLDDAVRVICVRTQLVRRARGKGGMAVVGLSLEATQAELAAFGDRLAVAIHNSPATTVISGEQESIDELLVALRKRGVFCRPVRIDYASHCAQMDSLLPELRSLVAPIRPRTCAVEFWSTVEGGPIDGALLDAGYWARNLRAPVLLAPAIARLADTGCSVFVDVSPHPVLADAVEQCLVDADRRRTIVASASRDVPEPESLLAAAARLSAVGVASQSVPEGERARLFVLSGSDEAAVRARASQLGEHLAANPELELADVAFSLATTRAHHEHRVAMAASSREALSAALALVSQGGLPAGAVRGRSPVAGTPKVVFVFPGQGSQWAGMGRQLLAEAPVFREAIEACDRAIAAETGWSLLDVLAEVNGSRLEGVEVVQPVLFAIEVALATLWRSWGVEPDAVVGHSMGEVAASVVAGALSLADATAVICRRSRLLGRISGQGEMAVVELSVADAEIAIAGHTDRLDVAVSNSPRSTVLAGEPGALSEVLAVLEARGVFCRRLRVDVASHSPQVDPLRDELLRALADLSPRTAQVPMRSTVTGDLTAGTELVASYWADNLRRPVRFASVIQALIDEGPTLFLEMSPHPTLLPSIEEMQQTSGAALGSLRRHQAERQTLLDSVGALYVHGCALDWKRVFPEGAQRVRLPSYPWQRERHWVDAPAGTIEGERAHGGGHPLLGPSISLATPAGMRVWETPVDVKRLPWLADHRTREALAFPAACFMEMAFAAATELLGGGPLEVVDLVLPHALSLPCDAPVHLQVVGQERSRGVVGLHIASQTSRERGVAWTEHLRGSARRAFVEEVDVPLDLRAVRARLGTPMDPDALYDALARMQLPSGRAFRGIAELWRSESESLARLALPDLAGSVAPYRIHPALLDACLQVAYAPWADREETPWVPVSVSALRLGQNVAPGELWCHARVTDESEDRRSACLVIVDGTGAVLAEASGVVVQRSTSAPARRAEDDWFLGLDWETSRLPASQRSSAGRWLLLGDGDGLGTALRAALEAAGHVVDHAFGRGLDDGSVDGMRALLGARALNGSTTAIVHLRSLDRGDESDSIEAALVRGCDGALHTVNAITSMGWRDVPRLWLITRGAQALGNDVAVAQAPLLGLGRVIAREHAELRCARLDLDPARPSNELASLLAELLADEDEDEVALRGDARRIARLARVTPEAGRAERVEPAGDRPFRLEIDAPGDFDQLVLRAVEAQPPSAGEVRIEVAAAGLNFIDVMKAMGTYPDLASEPISLGGECAGRIVAIGEGVEALSLGLDVVAFASRGLATHVTVDARRVAARPSRLSAAQAAGQTVALMTAWQALVNLVRIRAGDRVLIHSATGGVGLAALQIARQFGAEVFATAGSDAKRAWLLELGVTAVWDSRTFDFRSGVLEATQGEGVDVVLNSLWGDAIDASLATLAHNGRFIEIGKKGIDADCRLGRAPLERSLSYSAVDLAGLAEHRPVQFAALLAEVIGRLDRGTLEPLPVETFAVSRAADAFRKMAQAQHVGKVVVTLEDPAARILVPAAVNAPVRADGSYLVTGGLGGLGLSIAGWLVEQGAGHVVLVGRSGTTTPAQQTAVDALQENGARVTIARADIAERNQVARVLDDVKSTGLPLRGVIHAAGLLDDGPLSQLTPARLRDVMAPKVQGAWNLHELTRTSDVELFVLCSSAAGLLGSPGLGSHAAASAFLDALAWQRRGQGLPAVSVDWGAFSEGSAAAEKANGGLRLEGRGIRKLAPAQGLAALARVLAGKLTQVAIMPLDVRQWLEFSPSAASSRMLSRLVAAPRSNGRHPASDDGLLERLAVANPAERAALLEAFLRQQASQVLRLPLDKLDSAAPLTSLGMDSLMGLELRNRIETCLGIRIPATLVWKYPTVESLSLHLAGAHNGAKVAIERAGEPQLEAANDAMALGVLQAMTSDEKAKLLDERLAQLAQLVDGSDELTDGE